MTQLSNSTVTRIINAIAAMQMNGRTRIPVGALCFQDCSVFRWPNGVDGPIDPDLDFTVSVKGSTVSLVAPGFGELETGRYGNGQILMKLSEWRRAHGVAATAAVDREGCKHGTPYRYACDECDRPAA